MNMQNWLNARCAQLLTDINDTPLTDDADEVKLKLLMSAMRESTVEMFHRAAENSRKEIDKLNNAARQETVEAVQEKMSKPTEAPKEVKPAPKIKLKSSIIRRVDSF